MIFINYRREDTREVVTNLYGRLADRYGKDNVFVDFHDIPPGEKWPEVLRRKVEESLVLLAVVGPRWGEARFPADWPDRKRRNRLRLDDPDDWVRVEISAALGRREAGEMRVVVVPIDGAELPDAEWGGKLDELPTIQQARIRNQKDFARDVEELCRSLEEQIPPLQQAAESRRAPPAADGATARAVLDPDGLLRRYVASEVRNHSRLQLPLISEQGQPVVVELGELRIDLPLIVSHEHAPESPKHRLPWLGHDVLSVNDELRGTHTNALLVDRASRHEDIRRDCDVTERLRPGSRIVVVGDPGSGKSTLLQWICHHYAARQQLDAAAEAPGAEGLPERPWLPLLILCRDLVDRSLPEHLGDLLRTHLKLRQHGDDEISVLVPELERRLGTGRVILLVDGLDEIPDSQRRSGFARLLTSLADRFPEAPIVVTSRVVGFQAVRESLATKFDHLVVGPLDQTAKRAFLERWAELLGWNAARTAELVRQVCHSRRVAKLTDNVFLLAMIAQMQLVEGELPGRRVDVYRRALQLMVRRRRPFPGPTLSANELVPHLEFLAYSMRRQGVQRWNEVQVAAAFRELRRLEPEEPVLQSRPPEELLRACVESVGLLNVAGTETDPRGFDRRVVQFFHQSFQEYFAGQAINHGRDGAGEAGVAARLRDLLASVEIREREVELRDTYVVAEPVIADYWQEAVRLAIAGLGPGEADDALLMLLPALATPAPEARARAVFALQCLADEPAVSPATVQAVLDAALDNLREGDGFNIAVNTWMDEAWAAARESAFAAACRDHLIAAYVQTRGIHRERIACCLVGHLLDGDDAGPITTNNVEGAITRAEAGLSSRHVAERVSSGLVLMNRLYVTGGVLGFLAPCHQQDLVQTLVAALDRDEATASAALWALTWLTGSTQREGDFVLLPHDAARAVERTMRRPDLDPIGFKYGCSALTREQGIETVVRQQDWKYELAVIADGARPRRDLAPPRPTGRRSTDWLLERLTDPRFADAAARTATALGAFGIFVPEMVRPLRELWEAPRSRSEDRDEAMLYLALLATPDAVALLVDAADGPHEEDPRGLFGLLLLDDVDVLAAQLDKALPQADLVAYAYGLAGSRDPRGMELLLRRADHREERIRQAVERARSASWL